MPTVQEILRQTGFTDEQISGLDQRAVGAFSQVLSSAEQARQAAAADAERAALERRSNSQFYEESIVPALNGWSAEKAHLDAQLAYYQRQNESARMAGLDFAPPPDQLRDGGGRYVAGAPGATPGSPTFDPGQIRQALSSGVSNIGWAMQSYSKLHPGEVLPDSFDQLDAEATAQRLPFRDYVSRKYDYAGKQKAMQEKAQREHDEKIRQEERTAANREWAEKTGSNPDVRRLEPSRFADIARATKAGERPDPLTLSTEQRRQVTRQAIRNELSDAGEAA